MSFPDQYADFRIDNPDLNISSLGEVNVEVPDKEKPRICLMGLQKSGKTSILKVVFDKLPPQETHFLKTTQTIEKRAVKRSSFIDFHIWDFPGQIDFLDTHFEPTEVFGEAQAIVFVIDGADSKKFEQALKKLVQTTKAAVEVNRKIEIVVFVHKADALTEDQKTEMVRDISLYVEDNVPVHKNINLNYVSTSIYDHTIFEAISQVIQRLIPQLPLLSKLLDILATKCHLSKTFLFDISSRLYIGTDSKHVSQKAYEICSDAIELTLGMSSIYGVEEPVKIAREPYNDQSKAIITLSDGQVLYLRQVTGHLCLVSLIPDSEFKRYGLLEYNFLMFENAIEKFFSPDSKRETLI